MTTGNDTIWTPEAARASRTRLTRRRVGSHRHPGAGEREHRHKYLLRLLQDAQGLRGGGGVRLTSSSSGARHTAPRWTRSRSRASTGSVSSSFCETARAAGLTDSVSPHR